MNNLRLIARNLTCHIMCLRFNMVFHTNRSNLPKEIMELSGFPHTGVGDACYFPAAYIQKYLNDFTDHFNLRPYIKASQIILSEIKKNIFIQHYY